MIVTHVHSASHFSARILDSVRKDELTGKEIITKFENNIVQVNMKMLKYYSRHGNRYITFSCFSVNRFSLISN